MINYIPKSWEYNDSLEMLYLFYQSSEELLSDVTSDTYSLPLHNSLSLIDEIVETYFLLKKHSSLDEFYKKYIPPIIDELISKIKDDYLLKKQFGKRLDSIIIGFEQAKTNHQVLERWLDVFKQSCSKSEYRFLYQHEIIDLIENTKDKSKLLYCTINFYIALINVGYSREYLYVSARNFFDNRLNKIKSKNQIKDYLNTFSCVSKSYDFLVLMDMDSIEYLDTINDDIKISKNIEKIDVEKDRKSLYVDVAVADLIKQYDRKKHTAKKHQKIEIVKVHDSNLDPYKSITNFKDHISFLQTFKQYFIHHRRSKQVFTFLLKKQDGRYASIKLPNKFRKRPFINQELIDSRINNIMKGEAFGKSAFISLARAIAMHTEAFDTPDTSNAFRTFWTALETLFANPSHNDISRDNVINSTLAIVQKTYILKKMRALYSQITAAISADDLKTIGIFNFNGFIEYFSAHLEDSEEMKKIYALLSTNPLLRSRIFTTRKELKDGESIRYILDVHRIKIEWQLKRLYRIRNIATHMGTEITGADTAINHLHSYFDYIVNYMLCKSENGNFVPSISALVFEAKNDISIHEELLKSKETLSEKNYEYYLFGPDRNIHRYQFEH